MKLLQVIFFRQLDTHDLLTMLNCAFVMITQGIAWQVQLIFVNAFSSYPLLNFVPCPETCLPARNSN